MLNRESTVPLYLQLYELLKKEIINYPIMSNLPPERTLCESYGVDRITIRKALTRLANEGYIERRQGRGTTVLCHELNKTGKVLFLISPRKNNNDRLSEPFYALSVSVLEEEFQKHNKRLFYSKVMLGDDIADLCERMDAQAVIIVCDKDGLILQQCQNLHIPVITYNMQCEGFSSVMVNNIQAAAVSAKHLLDLGHRHIGFLYVPQDENSEQRLAAYRSELYNHDFDDAMLFITESDWSEPGGYKSALSLLSDKEKGVTAIFAGNDSMAIGAMRAAKELGLRVPEDVSIVGFDGIPQLENATPTLTTTRVHYQAMAEATCMLINHSLQNGLCSSLGVTVACDFMIGGSTAPVKAEQ